MSAAGAVRLDLCLYDCYAIMMSGMVITRAITTGLLGFSFAFGWPFLFSPMIGYIWISVPALLAAWAAAWYGDEVSDLIGIGSDELVRGVGLLLLAIMVIVTAAARWQWVH